MENNTATKLIQITRKAKAEPKFKFTFLKYLLNESYLMECFTELKMHKAAGVDGRTLESYTEAEMQQAIHATIIDMKENQYRPQPVRRVQIPKSSGKTRPLGIPTVIDKWCSWDVPKYSRQSLNRHFTSLIWVSTRDGCPCLSERD